MKRRIVLTLIFLAFVVGAVVAGCNIYSIVSEYNAGEQTYGDIQRFIELSEPTQQTEEPPADADPVEETASAEQSTQSDFVYPEVDFESLLSINEDVVAWVYIEGTNINYPVVQGEDNRHYVTTMIDGTYNSAGSIFMDYRNQPEFTDRHTILYGHNMRNEIMFHDICSYQNQEYYDAHPTGLIMTPEGNYRFDIVAGYVASLADPAWQLEFVSDEDMLDWLHDAIARSGFTSTTQPKPGDRLITLSTCSYEFNDARFVLIGVLK